MKEDQAITVFYDGKCPLCRREISFYMRKSRADNIIWADISLLDGCDVLPGLKQKDALKRFHLLDYGGQLLSGAEAFAALWIAVPPFQLLGRVAQKQPFTCTLEILYRLFLLIRPHLQSSLRMCATLPAPGHEMSQTESHRPPEISGQKINTVIQKIKNTHLLFYL